MKAALTSASLLIALASVTGHAQTPVNGVPSIRLDKSVFASDEAVFFWVGVERAGKSPIPKEYWNTGRVTITRPDGTVKVMPVNWPIDGSGTYGPGDNGWTGGWGLGETAKPGRYQLVMEFAGQKTSPTSLTVEDLPILKRIKAAFVFGPPVTTKDGVDTPLTLTVHNDTDQVIRFPHRDGMNGLVSVELEKPDGSYHNSGFYPSAALFDQDEQKLPDRGFDEFRWKDTQYIPTITLQPGQVYNQHLSLRTVVADNNKRAASGAGLTISPGSYQVTFSTMLQVLIGEENGEFSAVSPVHIPVVAAATCAVAPST